MPQDSESEAKLEQEAKFKSYLEALIAPIPGAIAGDVENSYVSLFRTAYGIPVSDEENLTVHFPTSDGLTLQQTMYDIFSRNSGAFNPLSAAVLVKRYGLTTGKTQTVKEVAGFLGLTSEKINGIEGRALQGLRYPTIRDIFIPRFVEIHNP